MSTLVLYPDPNPEVSTVDGLIRNSNANHTTCRNGATGDLSDDSSAQGLPGCSNTTSGDFFITRAFFLFDTASLSGLGLISSANLSIFGSGKNDANGESVNVYTSSPASNTALTTADYDQVGSTSLATAITVASFSTSAYNDFALTSSGFSSIIQTGVTKLALRMSGDVNDTSPSASNDIRFYFADQGGTTNDPKLTITYSDTTANILMDNCLLRDNTSDGLLLSNIGTVSMNGSIVTGNGGYGVNVGSGCGYTRIHGNFFRNNTSGAINDAGTNTQDADNIKA